MKLHSYQQAEADFMIAHQQCAVFAQTGTGKTAATLEAIKRLVVKRVPAVSHPRIARHVWPKEAVKGECPLPCFFAGGTRQQREKFWKKQEEGIWSVSYGSMCEAIRLHWDMPVFDESTPPLFKSYKSRRAQLPCNSLTELWMQIWLVDGWVRLFATKQRFMETYSADM